MGRFVEPDEVAEAILYLLSDRSSMIHGISLPLDAGFGAV
jgi:L-xylulose reductase